MADILRNRTLSEIASDVVARIEDDVSPITPETLCATNFEQIVERIAHLYTFPAVLVVPTGGSYEGRGSRRHRDDRVNVITVGGYSADVAGGDTDMWDAVDMIARRFLPGNDDDETPSEQRTGDAVEIQGVIYHPLSLRPVAVGAERTAMNLLLQALNPMAMFAEPSAPDLT